MKLPEAAPKLNCVIALGGCLRISKGGKVLPPDFYHIYFLVSN